MNVIVLNSCLAELVDSTNRPAMITLRDNCIGPESVPHKIGTPNIKNVYLPPKKRVNSNPKRNFFLSSIRAIIFHIAKAD